MRILVIMKRFGANKDMVMQNFGRQVRLFEFLSKWGHKIDFFCPDYTKYENKNIRINGINYYIRPYSILKHFQLLKNLKKLIKKNDYDYIVGSTDPLLCILGYRYARKFKTGYIYDMQDEYSNCYSSYKIPFVKYLDNQAVKNSDIVLTVSNSLNKHITKLRKKPTYTIQNGVNLNTFKKIEKKKARKILKLPKGKIIIYIGAISKFKGVNMLIDAFKEVKKSIPNSYLLLSGKVIDINVNQNSIIYKEYPKKDDVITALNAADVAVLQNKNSIFSQYCFPYKLAEYMATGLPIVSTASGDSSIILSKFKNSLCKPNDKYDMAKKLILRLKENKRVDYRNVLKDLTWESLSRKIDKIIKNTSKA